MQDNNKQEYISTVIENQKSDIINKKISFKKDTLRNLVTIASREHFESKMKQDEMLALTLDKIINLYFERYWNENKPNYFVDNIYHS